MAPQDRERGEQTHHVLPPIEDSLEPMEREICAQLGIAPGDYARRRETIEDRELRALGVERDKNGILRAYLSRWPRLRRAAWVLLAPIRWLVRTRQALLILALCALSAPTSAQTNSEAGQGAAGTIAPLVAPGVRSRANIHGGEDYMLPDGRRIDSRKNVHGGQDYRLPDGSRVSCRPNIHGGDDCR